MAVTGVKEILNSFDRMERAMQARVMRRSLNKAMNPMIGALRAAAPKGLKSHRTHKGRLVAPGFLSRSIKKSTRLGRDKDRVFGNVRVDGEAWYGSLIEHGWRPGKRSGRVRGESNRSLSGSRLKELGDGRGKISGKPWFWPTVNRLSDDVTDRFIDDIGDQIVKEWLK